MVVATERSEQLNTPSNIATVAVYASKIATVADNIDKLEALYNATTLITPEYKSEDFTVSEQKNYLVDTSNGTITISVDVDISSFFIGDFGSTWTDIKQVHVVIGTDTIILGYDNKNQRYHFVKHGNTFRVYDSIGTFKISGVI